MAAENAREFVVENARIIFSNFEGKEKTFNKEGDRNFAILIDDLDLVHNLREDGWNVKQLKPRNEEEEENPRYQLPVAVTYPKDYESLWPVVKVANPATKKITKLGKDEIKMLDWIDYTDAIVVIRPRRWTDDKTGQVRVKAFLKEIAVTLVENPIDERYADYSYDD